MGPKLEEKTNAFQASCLIGGPTNYPEYGDFTTAHVTRTYGKWWLKGESNFTKYLISTVTISNFDSGPSGDAFVRPYGSKGKYRNIDFVDLEFATPCRPDEIKIYETLNPGSIIEVCKHFDRIIDLNYTRISVMM